MNDVRTLWSRARECDAAGTAYALVTVVRAVAPTSARVGDKALVAAEGILDGWIGGGCAPPAGFRTVRHALAARRPRARVRTEPADVETPLRRQVRQRARDRRGAQHQQ
ncbi:MAG: XdhC family protein, partial [Betaproteobacteria bacterium]